MNYFICSKRFHAALWRFKRVDFNINSRWIDYVDKNGKCIIEISDFFDLIIEDIKNSDGILFYVSAHDFNFKTCLIECGIGLALGKPILIVGDITKNEKEIEDWLGDWVNHPLVSYVRTKNIDMILREYCSVITIN